MNITSINLFHSSLDLQQVTPKLVREALRHQRQSPLVPLQDQQYDKGKNLCLQQLASIDKILANQTVFKFTSSLIHSVASYIVSFLFSKKHNPNQHARIFLLTNHSHAAHGLL